MSLEKNFCPSPWFHMRITNNGDYKYCRWMVRDLNTSPNQNISQIHPVEWFQKSMATIRQDMLDGQKLDSCNDCHIMEQHGKPSGRQKQLLKVGVRLEDFEKTMLSSPWIGEWQRSGETAGDTDLYVQDWQIDLGNFCNSACLFCRPESSSRLAAEQYKLGLISSMPPRSWCDDPVLLDRFIDALQQSPLVKYLHFVGGETLITPAFQIILQRLIDVGLNKNLSIGFTTNLTVMDPNVLEFLYQFNHINLGVSVECLDPANDYIRYGGNIGETRQFLDQWIEIAQKKKWLVQIRTTPTILSILRLDTIYEYAWEHGAAVESCNFIEWPTFMRPSVLPIEYRRMAQGRLQNWIDRHQVTEDSDQIVNIRHPDFFQQQLLQDAQSYVRYLDSAPDESDLLPELVRYLKIMESNRGNCVLDYLPEYEELFRSAGY